MLSEREILVEFIIRKKYNKQGVTLPDKFWNLPKYKEEYTHQSRLAAKLLRAYKFAAIMSALEKNTWCWSLAPKRLQTEIEIEQKKIEAEENMLKLKKEQAEKQPEKIKMPLFRKQPDVKKEG